MAKSTKTKQNRRRKMTPLLTLACIVMIGIAGFLLFRVVEQVITTISLQQQLTEVQGKYQEVLDENNYLNQEKEKLQDPDYVENYARSNFQLTKEGEKIFYLPAKTEE